MRAARRVVSSRCCVRPIDATSRAPSRHDHSSPSPRPRRPSVGTVVERSARCRRARTRAEYAPRPRAPGRPTRCCGDQTHRRYRHRVRVALFSDVHANLPALEAILDDIQATGVDARYTLGDLVGYAPWPNEVLERLADEQIPGVMGNLDDGTGFDRDTCGCAYTDPAEEALGDAEFAWTSAHTTEANKAYLRSLAAEIRFETDGSRYLLVHGSPRRM